MEYRTLGRTGIRVSAIALGCEGFINKSAQEVKADFDFAIDRGINFVDIYSSNPDLRDHIGQALEGRRDRFVIQGHLCTTWENDQYLRTRDPKKTIDSFDSLLKQLRTDHVDVGMIHYVDAEKDFHTVFDHEIIEIAQRLKAEGKIRHIGFSFHDTADLLDEILTAHPEVEFVQLQINYLDWDSENVQSRRCYETAVKHGKQVVVMEPVKGGSLAHMLPEAEALLRSAHPDWSIPSWGIRFAASLDHVMVVLSGMSDLEQVRDNTGYMADFIPLTGEERDTVFQAAEILRKSIAIPCTACRYCVEGCPQNIAIPEYFELYNTSYQMGGRTSPALRMRYGFLQKDHGKASDCVACGQCESACPQHIEITQWLKKVAAVLEN